MEVSDDDDGGRGLEAAEKLLQETLDKLNVEKQINNCMEALDKRLKVLETDAKEINVMFDEQEEKLDKLRMSL